MAAGAGHGRDEPLEWPAFDGGGTSATSEEVTSAVAGGAAGR